MYQPACSRGDDVTGTVTTVTDYGAFVRLSIGDGDQPHHSGLIPLRDMTDRTDLKPAEIVKVGDKLELVVTRVIPSKQRVNLSLKEARKRHFLRSLVAKEQIYPGRVVEVRDFGALIDLGGGVNGALYKSRHSQGRFAFTAGQLVDVRVISVNVERGRFRVATADDTGAVSGAEAETIVALKPTEVNSIVTGSIFRILRHAAFVDLGDGAIGILYNSRARLSPDVKNIRALNVGQTMVARVIKVESGKRFSLSIKGVEQPVALGVAPSAQVIELQQPASQVVDLDAANDREDACSHHPEVVEEEAITAVA